jgi:hypothetical protein
VDIDQASIAKFLMEFKALLGTGRNFYFVERPERNSTLLDLGLTWTNFKKELLGLSVTDYYSGPEPDRDRKGEVWMFGKEINGREIYIKLKIVDLGTEKLAKCLSCHEANQPINYPFRK